MPTNLALFHRQLAADALKPAYLIAGAEHLLVLEAADALRARARELGYAEREVLDVEAHFDWNRLAETGSAMSLFSTLRLVDLRLPTGKPGKDGSAAIVAFCEAQVPDTVLLVTANDWSSKHAGAWVNAIERVGTFVPVWPLKREEQPAWLAARAKSRGVDISRAAIAFLADRVEGNLLAAAQEIDKLALLPGSAPIDVAELEANVAGDARFDVFRLTDAAIGGDAARALRIVAGLRAEGAEPIPLLGWILNQLRVLLRVASAGRNVDAALRAEYIRPAQRESLFRRALGQAGREHWEACLVQAGHIDRIAKGRATGDAWRELERLIAAIAAPRRARDLLA
jgi:DNA polymerase-3 subunit delta